MKLIKGIGVQNFKTFLDYTYIELSTLSFLIGKNGAGKSSFIQAAQFIFRFLSNPTAFRYFGDDEHKMIKNNKVADKNAFLDNFTHFMQFINDPAKPLIIDLFTDFNFDRGEFPVGTIRYRFVFSVVTFFGNNHLFLQRILLYDNDQNELLFTNRYDHDLQSYNIEFTKEGLRFLLNSFIKYIEFSDNSKKSQSVQLLNKLVGWNEKKNSLRDKYIEFKESLLFEIDDTGMKVNPVQEFSEQHGYEEGSVLTEINVFNDEIHSYVIGSNEMREVLDFSYQALKENYLQLAAGFNFVETIKISEIGFPKRTLDQSNSFLKPIKQFQNLDSLFIDNNLDRFNFKGVPVVELVSDDINDYKVVLVNKEGRNFNLKDAGSGYWILAYLIYKLAGDAKNGKILLIEEPETFLHPGFQAKLADMFLEAINTFDCQIIIETHSEYLIRRLQRRVAESSNFSEGHPIANTEGDKLPFSISPDQFAINYIDDNNKAAKVMHLHIQEDGNLDGNFPADFVDVSLKEALILFQIKEN